MNIYYCFNCKKLIKDDEVKVYREPSEAWGHTVYEEYLVCPYCGEPIEDIKDNPCIDCCSNEWCLSRYIENEELKCELGEEFLEYWEEKKQEWEWDNE